MPVIWGLDLKEIQWSKFGSKNMWNGRYHLRRTRFIVYQLAMIFCVVSESLGTAALSDYLDQGEFIRQLDNSAVEYSQDYVAIGSYNIFSGVFVATIFGAAFFFDLFWPERHESPSVRLAWKICAVLAVLFEAGAAFGLTVVTATGAASLTGVEAEMAGRLLAMAKPSPLVYRQNGRAVAAVVFIWPGLIFTLASCVLLFLSQAHDDKFGDPYGSRFRAEVKGESTSVTGDTEGGSPMSHETARSEKPLGATAPGASGQTSRPFASDNAIMADSSHPSFDRPVSAIDHDINSSKVEPTSLTG